MQFAKYWRFRSFFSRSFSNVSDFHKNTFLYSHSKWTKIIENAQLTLNPDDRRAIVAQLNTFRKRKWKFPIFLFGKIQRARWETSPLRDFLFTHHIHYLQICNIMYSLKFLVSSSSLVCACGWLHWLFSFFMYIYIVCLTFCRVIRWYCMRSLMWIIWQRERHLLDTRPNSDLFEQKFPYFFNNNFVLFIRDNIFDKSLL